MSAEIERKYTVKDQSYRQESIECKYYKQGYISIDKERTVRIRISGNNAFITLKGVTTGCTRKEFEYPMLPKCSDHSVFLQSSKRKGTFIPMPDTNGK